MEEKNLSENLEQKRENILNNIKIISKDKLNQRYSINIYYKNKKRVKFIRKIIFFLILFNSFILILSDIEDIFNSNYSYITLKVKGTGRKFIYSSFEFCRITYYEDFQVFYPDEVYLNGEKRSDKSCRVELNQTDNIVVLVWKTNNINSTQCLFYECRDITEIDFSNFDSSKVAKIDNMFYDCSKLKSINFGNFNTSNVIKMFSMFEGCYSLTSLNLSSFNTSKVESMDYMFYNCSSLISLDLSSFNTSKTKNFAGMFQSCSSLKSLDISNFYISESAEITEMFYKCLHLEYINLENSNIFSNSSYENLFKVLSDKLIICFKDKNWLNFLEGYDSFINCIYDNNEISIKEEFNCYKKNNLSVEYDLNTCEKCGEFYYQVYNDTFNNNSNIVCYNEPEGYFFDEDNLVYKPCYPTCKTCNKEGNDTYHNCLECCNGYKNKLIFENNINCYNICKNYYYIDNISNKSFCTHNLTCPEDYNKLIENKKECIDNCIKDIIYKYEYEGLCLSECPDNTIYNSYICENITYGLVKQISYTNIKTFLYSSINELATEIISETLHDKGNTEANSYELENRIEVFNNIINKSDFESVQNYLLINYNKTTNKQEIIINKKSMILTTTVYQRNNKNENKTSIDLGQCEDELKIFYNISNDSSLYIYKIEIKEEGMKIPKIEYEIYYPLYK